MSDKTKLLAQLGFGSIYILILVLSYFMLSHFSKFQENMTNVVENNNTKSELARIMRDSIRMRAISLRNMLVEDDIFERDQELLRFDTYAAQFSDAREKLLNLPKTDGERKIFEDLRKAIHLAQPLNKKASEHLLSESYSYEKTKLIVNQAFQGQEKVLALLDELVEFQKQSSAKALHSVSEEYQGTKKQLVVVVLAVGFMIFFILFTISRFITQKNQELQVATETKSMFLANMSHEIRTPLTAIIGFTKLLHGKRIPVDKQQSTLETVVKNAEHLLNIINDILDISKIEANRLDLDLTEISLSDCINDVKNMVGGPIKKKGLKFVVNYKFPLPTTITSDEVRLKQILVNLCSNATKFTEQGHIIIDILFDRKSKFLHFSVTDSGIGLSQNQIQKIFSAFQQAESSTTRKFGGTGLGLSISRQLVSMLGGELTVSSKTGEGSTFKFYIELGESDHKDLCYSTNDFKHVETDSFEIIDNINVRGHILLVDDTVDNQVLLSTYLSDMGAETIVAENGKIAVELASKNKFDLILMDMQMPVMGGLEAVKLIKEKEINVPIVMLTANALKEERDQCYEAGCADFLTKPIDIGELCRVVSEYLPAAEKPNTNETADIKKINAVIEASPAKIEIEIDDQTKIISSVMGTSETIDKMVVNFVAQLPKYVSDIESAYQNEDVVKLSYVTHQFKGVAGNYGFLMITDTCVKIEKAISSEKLNDVKEYIVDLKSIITKIDLGLDSYKQRTKLA